MEGENGKTGYEACRLCMVQNPTLPPYVPQANVICAECRAERAVTRRAILCSLSAAYANRASIEGFDCQLSATAMKNAVSDAHTLAMYAVQGWADFDRGEMPFEDEPHGPMRRCKECCGNGQK